MAALVAQQQPQHWSGHSRLVVRHTFLDVVEDGDEPQPSIQRRSQTDSALWRQAAARLADYEPGRGAAPIREGSDGSDLEESSSTEPQDVCALQSAGCSSSCAQLPGRADGAADVGAKLPAEATERRNARTTLMLRNLPNNYTRQMLLAMLDSAGFAGKYDFVYLPIDFSRGCGLGYAFINLVSPEVVACFREAFAGFRDWAIPSAKICEVTWSEPHQGLKANIKRYRNSPVMHPSVPAEYKPCIFDGGKEVPFPAPGCRVGRPQVRGAKL